MTVLNANEIGYYDLNKKIVECDDNDITITLWDSVISAAVLRARR